MREPDLRKVKFSCTKRKHKPKSEPIKNFANSSLGVKPKILCGFNSPLRKALIVSLKATPKGNRIKGSNKPNLEHKITTTYKKSRSSQRQVNINSHTKDVSNNKDVVQDQSKTLNNNSFTVKSILSKKNDFSWKELVLYLDGEYSLPEDTLPPIKKRGLCFILLYIVVLVVVVFILQLHSVYLFTYINDKVLTNEILKSRCITDTWLAGDCVDAIINKDPAAQSRIGERYKSAALKQKPNREHLVQEFFRSYFSPSGYYADYARYWFTKAGLGNNRQALFELFLLYSQNNENNKVTNEMLLRSSAAQGYPPAQLYMYENNIGGSKTHNFQMLREAAASGYVPAQVALGQEYADGLVVERNPMSAQLWFVRAARRGSLMAMLALVRLYADSIGELPDAKVRHYVWAKHFYKCQQISQEAAEVDFDYSVMTKMYLNISNSTFTPREQKRTKQIMDVIQRDYPCVKHSPSARNVSYDDEYFLPLETTF